MTHPDNLFALFIGAIIVLCLLGILFGGDWLIKRLERGEDRPDSRHDHDDAES